jgi:hypothetical protein
MEENNYSDKWQYFLYQMFTETGIAIHFKLWLKYREDTDSNLCSIRM